ALRGVPEPRRAPARRRGRHRPGVPPARISRTIGAMPVRTVFRWLGTTLVVSGVLVLAWVVLVWQWQDPFTALYTKWEQRELRSEYAHRLAEYRAPRVVAHNKKRDVSAYELSIAAAAPRHPHPLHQGDPIRPSRVPPL